MRQQSERLFAFTCCYVTYLFVRTTLYCEYFSVVFRMVIRNRGLESGILWCNIQTAEISPATPAQDFSIISSLSPVSGRDGCSEDSPLHLYLYKDSHTTIYKRLCTLLCSVAPFTSFVRILALTKIKGLPSSSMRFKLYICKVVKIPLPRLRVDTGCIPLTFVGLGI